MRRNGRKEVALVSFDGVTEDGGFVFMASVFVLNKRWNRTETEFKTLAYENGVMEIAVDWKETIPHVAQLVAGMFSRKSNFGNLAFLILNYRNTCFRIGRNTGRKDIICMLMKAMSEPNYKNEANVVFVDTQTCQRLSPLRVSDRRNMQYEFYTNSFCFDEILKWGKSLLFMNSNTMERIAISAMRDGIVTVESSAGSLISDFVAELKKFFVPYSNFYGVKALEVNFNQFSTRVDEQNIDKILYLYKKSCDMSSGLWEREMQEYYDSSEYVRNRAKFLKKEHRKKAVIKKVRQFQKENVDFSIADKKKQEEWEKCKEINSKDDYSSCVIDYTILWAQYMEYLMGKHGKKLSDVWDMSSSLADIYGITGFMYGCAVSTLSSVWKYGKELRVQYNSKFNYNGEGVVNPAILTLS